MKQSNKDQVVSKQSQSPSFAKHHTVGWVFMAGYLVMAALAFYEANTCAEMLCDLVALPALFPFGFMFYWLIDSAYFSYPTSSGIPGDHLRSWYFIVPTVLLNTVFFYWAGRTLARLAHWAGRILKP